MAAEAQQRQVVRQLAHVSRPELDRLVGPLQPLALELMNHDRAAELVRPFDHRCVVVRVRDRDRAQAAARLDEGRHLVEEGEAVPEHVSGRRLDEERTLADAELRLHADPGQPRLFPPDVGAV